MELITNKISLELQKLIESSFVEIKDLITEKNKRINHVNVYHKDWGCSSCSSIIKILHNDYSIDPNNIISLGFICSQVNSYNQHWHIDYNATTETYFIPLIDLDNNNGTEYVEFVDNKENINLLNELIEITNKYIDITQISEHFTKMSIPQYNYAFKILNTNAWSMVKLPYYLFHRGQSNKGTVDRIMFQIIVKKTNNTCVSDKVQIDDSELDELLTTQQKLLISRQNNEIFNIS
jgi:hypothetical protein